MTKKIIAVGCMALLLTCFAAPALFSWLCPDSHKDEITLATILGQLQEYPPAEPSEVRAVWISYLDLAPMLQGKTALQFRDSVREMYDNCLSLGLNTVMVQVRPFGDSLYPSAYFPWSAVCTGTLGNAPDYDPLQILVDEAKARALRIHAWINPMRAMTAVEAASVPDSYSIGQWYRDATLFSKHLMEVEGRLYGNPASDAVRTLIADGAAELVRNYPVDGIHLDDYFYPPNLPDSCDQASYNAYLAAGGEENRGDWRRSQVSLMIAAIYDAVKGENAAALVGISPRGVIDQSRDQLYADVERWCTVPGYCDYVAPQLYYGFSHATAPYDATLRQWEALTADATVSLWVGLAAYKVGQEDSYAGSGRTEWQDSHDLLARQIDTARNSPSYGGVIFFRYGSLFAPAASVAEKIKMEKETIIDRFR